MSLNLRPETVLSMTSKGENLSPGHYGITYSRPFKNIIIIIIIYIEALLVYQNSFE
jgi:hypothetical protein